MYLFVLSIKFRFFQKKLAAKSVQCQENGNTLKKDKQPRNETKTHPQNCIFGEKKPQNY